MRCGICAFAKKPFLTAIMQSKVSHFDNRCIWSSAIITKICNSLINNKIPSLDLIRCSMNLIGNEFDKFMDATLEELKLDGDGRGYTLKTTACGIYALKCIIEGKVNNASDFKRIICDIANQGGDADTNCAVAGQVLGAYLGYSKLPSDWLKQLIHKDWLDKKVNAYYDVLVNK
jgi:ADP-ribosylglycohydrolase